MKTFITAAIAYAASAVKIQGFVPFTGCNRNYSEEMLYGGLRDNIRDIFFETEIDDDNWPTIKEWMELLYVPNADELFAKYGSDIDMLWWRDAKFVSDVLWGFLDWDADGRLTSDDLRGLFPMLKIHDKYIDKVYKDYVHDSDKGLDKDEFTQLLDDWIYAKGEFRIPLELTFVPSWYQQPEDELFKDMNKNWPDMLEGFDYNLDGVVSMPEFLHGLNSPNSKEVIERYGQDMKFWTSGDCLRDCGAHDFDLDSNGLYDYDEVMYALKQLGVGGDLDKLYSEMQPDKSQPLDSELFGLLLNGWTYGILDDSRAEDAGEDEGFEQSLQSIYTILDEELAPAVWETPYDYHQKLFQIGDKIRSKVDNALKTLMGGY